MNIEQYTDIKRYNTLAKKINEVVKELYNFEKQFNGYKDGIEELKKELIDEVGESTQNFENIINNKLDNLEHYENEFSNVETKNVEQDKRLIDIEKMNKVQDIYVQGLFNENNDKRLTLEGEGNSLKLEGSKEGLVTVDKVVGNTLVNMADKVNGGFSLSATGNHTYVRVSSRELVNNTVYSLILNVQDVSFSNGYPKIRATRTNGSLNYEMANRLSKLSNGFNVCTLTFSEDVKTLTLYVDASDVGVLNVNWCILLEGDYTNKPIPSEYFQGMQSSFENQLVTQEMVDSGEESVENLGKYRVDAKVRGKNLFDGNWEYGSINDSTGSLTNASNEIRSVNFIKVYPGQKLCFTFESSKNIAIRLYDINRKYIGATEILIPSGTVVSGNAREIPKNAYYMKVKLIETNLDLKLQIEEGTQATPYEPYYECIQTVYLNSPLHKGDEIVCIDGELKHYHKMGEVVLDKNTKVTHNGDVGDVSEYLIGEESDLFDNTSPTNLICDKFTVGQPSDNSQSIFLAGKLIRVRLFTRDYPNSTTVVNYLSTNNVNVLFKLKEPYYETIDTDKLLLEIPNNATVSVKSVVPVQSMTASYTNGIPNVYGLQETNQVQDDIIDTTLLATDELYNMIEPLLYMIPQTIPLNSESKMVEFYYIMLIRKLKTIDEIPQRYKILVEEKIKEGDINVK